MGLNTDDEHAYLDSGQAHHVASYWEAGAEHSGNPRSTHGSSPRSQNAARQGEGEADL